jgi:beta-glucosidase
MIHINANKTYQTIIGLGSSPEHSTCYNLSLLVPTIQENVVEKIVYPDKGIGMSLMRICIGTPDFTASLWYSYDDMSPGHTDPELKHFSIEKDRTYVLPALKLALKKNPTLRFFASPWSPPGWMKTNGSLCGGRINPDCFRAYAEYLARFAESKRYWERMDHNRSNCSVSNRIWRFSSLMILSMVSSLDGSRANSFNPR